MSATVYKRHGKLACAGGFAPFDAQKREMTRGSLQIVDKKLFSPEGGRIALSANERIAEFLEFAIQAEFAYVSKQKRADKRLSFLCVNYFCTRWTAKPAISSLR